MLAHLFLAALAALAVSNVCLTSPTPPVNAVVKKAHAASSTSSSSNSNQREYNIHSSRLAGKRIKTEQQDKESLLGASPSSSKIDGVDLNLHLGLGPRQKSPKLNVQSSTEPDHFGPLQMKAEPRLGNILPAFMDDGDSRSTRKDRPAELHDVWLPGYRYTPNVTGRKQDETQLSRFRSRKHATEKRVGDMIDKYFGPSNNPVDRIRLKERILKLGKDRGIYDEEPDDVYQRTKHWTSDDLFYHRHQSNENDKKWKELIHQVAADFHKQAGHP